MPLSPAKNNRYKTFCELIIWTLPGFMFNQSNFLAVIYECMIAIFYEMKSIYIEELLHKWLQQW